MKASHFIQPFDIAEAAHGKRQVSGDYQHHRIIHVAGFLVEFARGHGADRGIQAGNDIEYFFLAGKIASVTSFKSLFYQREIRCFIAYFRKGTFNFDGIACEQ